MKEKFQRLKKILNSESKDYSGIFFHAFHLYKDSIKVLLFNQIIILLCKIKGVNPGKNIQFNGMPIIRRYPNSSIIIGNNCIINSAKNSISIGLTLPCAFITSTAKAKIIIGNNTGVSGLKISARSKVKIGNNVLIGSACTILDNDGHHSNLKKREKDIIPSRPVIIEDNVFIGLQCVILKGVKIGRNSVIGAGSVVTNDIPENSIALGNPCKVIIKRNGCSL